MDDQDIKVDRKTWKKVKHGLLYEKIRRSGYKISTPLILVFFLVPIGLLAYNGFSSGWADKWAVRCPEDATTECKNPFYSCDPLTTTWCPDEKTRMLVCTSNPGFCIMPLIERGGRYGDEQTIIEKNFFLFTIGVLAVGYGLNHYLYNRKEDREERRRDYARENRQSEQD